MATGAFPLSDIPGATASAATTARASVCSLQWNPIGSRVAGDGTFGDGLQQLNDPRDVVLDLSNRLVIADIGNNRIQRWVIGGPQGETVAGQANGDAGDAQNQLSRPEGAVVAPNGNIYVADSANDRVQLWLPGAAVGQTIPGPGKIA
ncbi:unnamed protein product [Rotaria sordida]|uniref:NHL repeat-containing protein n=1 Tax=Rotaria sordida TaxID=392033 RepID=A0A819P286_9BILA|nr:unnamed protein product [Rotaria sordida]